MDLKEIGEGGLYSFNVARIGTSGELLKHSVEPSDFVQS
jgi:hypothetical protein